MSAPEAPEAPEAGGDIMLEKHCQYVLKLDTETDQIEYWASEFLRLSGVYWGLSAMYLIKREKEMDLPGIVKLVMEAQNPDGGFGGYKGHDSSIIYTLSAVQLLMMCGELKQLDQTREKVVEFVQSLQTEEGSFKGDKWGELDMRYSYCSLSTLALLGRLDAVNVEASAKYVSGCQNWDGGFGATTGMESHGAMIFCAIGALSILDRLDTIDADRLGWWLAERQAGDGGLNGRPEKKSDVCYSWWVLSSMAMIRKLHWIDGQALCRFIIKCQDEDEGGFGDAPGNMSDVFHTFFALCGLSLLGHAPEVLGTIDPVFAMPHSVLREHGITSILMGPTEPEA